MCREFSFPSSGAQQPQQQPLILPLERGGNVVGRGPTTLLPPRSNGKPKAATAVHKLLMMGMRIPDTRWAVFKRQAINLRDWCIRLVDLFECMMMHGLTNPKFLEKFSKNTNVMKIRPVGAEFFCADWRTDRHAEINNRFFQFCQRS
jgi:hypothetical protein